jgi:hypothetical protein
MCGARPGARSLALRGGIEESARAGAPEECSDFAARGAAATAAARSAAAAGRAAGFAGSWSSRWCALHRVDAASASRIALPPRRRCVRAVHVARGRAPALRRPSRQRVRLLRRVWRLLCRLREFALARAVPRPRAKRVEMPSAPRGSGAALPSLSHCGGGARRALRGARVARGAWCGGVSLERCTLAPHRRGNRHCLLQALADGGERGGAAAGSEASARGRRRRRREASREHRLLLCAHRATHPLLRLQRPPSVRARAERNVN